MARTQFNVRVPQHTHNQIADIIAWLPAESQSHAAMVAIARLWNELKPAACPKCRRDMDVIEAGKWYSCPECDK